MNKVILIGRLTKETEMRYTQSNTPVTSFTLAVDSGYNSKTEERMTEFVNCVAWSNKAENIAKYCNKGSQIAIEGRISTRTYDAQDGTRKYITEVVVDNATFLGSKSTEEDKSNETMDKQIQRINDSHEDPLVLTDDDLPF